MELEPRASEQLAHLYDTAPPLFCDRIDQILDELERDNGQAWLRLRRFQNPPVYVLPVNYGAYDYLIMWRLDGKEAVVVYIGPTF